MRQVAPKILACPSAYYVKKTMLMFSENWHIKDSSSTMASGKFAKKEIKLILEEDKAQRLFKLLFSSLLSVNQCSLDKMLPEF